MLTTVSLNLNKRVNSAMTRVRLAQWLQDKGVHLLFAQEPWKQPVSQSCSVADLVPLGGNNKVWAWVDSRLVAPEWKLLSDYCMQIKLGYLVVFNVYLDAYEQRSRAVQLEGLIKMMGEERNRPSIVIGDFNIAPSETDGLRDGLPSTFNSEVDREPLKKLMDSMRLVDLGSRFSDAQWTIERQIGGHSIQFRCDLALASDYVAPDIVFEYDHSVRIGVSRFTDHSALCLKVGVTLSEHESQMTLFPRERLNKASEIAHSFSPHKTAMHRRKPSPIARMIMSDLRSRLGIESILDYGCGYGEDVRFYRSFGLTADGYDPCPTFGWAERSIRDYDLVTMLFVLNVLPDPWTRLKAIQEAASFLAPKGLLIIATRTAKEIEDQARRKSWPDFNDGYWSHEGKGTFQRGLNRGDLLLLAKRAGFTLSSKEKYMRAVTSSSCVVLERPIDSNDCNG